MVVQYSNYESGYGTFFMNTNSKWTPKLLIKKEYQKLILLQRYYARYNMKEKKPL